MTRVPGERLGRIFLDLLHNQLDSIQDQLAYILEYVLSLSLFRALVDLSI